MELGARVSPGALRRPRLPGGVRPTAAAFQVDDDHGGRRLRVRVPSARSVELAGDFTNWQPIALKQGDTDEWEVTLPIAPGVHRLAIRVDGDRWTTPPGVVTVADEFQGTVGVIVVR
jgi:1,4-alpha-glucan branching enzyme